MLSFFEELATRRGEQHVPLKFFLLVLLDTTPFQKNPCWWHHRIECSVLDSQVRLIVVQNDASPKIKKQFF